MLAIETGYGSTRTTYGNGNERLSQNLTLLAGTEASAQTTIAKENSKVYFQRDHLGSELFASNQDGEVLRYAKRDTWGNLTVPAQGNLNLSGIENGLRFTNYNYDAVLDKYFAQARFYDARNGRMLAKDPVHADLNVYRYALDNPVNYIDPDGELSIFGGAIVGGIIGGIVGAASSVISQAISGKPIDAKKVLGSAVNGMITGAVQGALLATPVGVPKKVAAAIGFAANFVAGAAGNAAEQKIVKGSVDTREALSSGLTNAASGLIYGNNPVKNAKDAFGKGTLSGAVQAGIRNIVETGRDTYDYEWSNHECNEDCLVGSSSGYVSHSYQKPRPSSWDFMGFVKDVTIGGITGGIEGLGFYGAGRAFNKAANAVGNSIKLVVASGSEHVKKVIDRYKNRFKITPELINHINNVDPKVPRKKGIGGAHNSETFFANDIKIVSRKPHPRVKGVEIVEYQMPKRDGAGNVIIGEYQSGIAKVKTVYNPQIISTLTYIKRGLQAANNALKKSSTGVLPHEWTGVDRQGVTWRGYFQDGIITSFYPN